MILYHISLWYYNFWSWVWVWVSWWSFLPYKDFSSAAACSEADCGQEQWFHTPSSGHQQHQTQLALSCHRHLLNSDNKYIHWCQSAGLCVLCTTRAYNCFNSLCFLWCQLLGHPNIQNFWLCTCLKHFWLFYYKHFNMNVMLRYTYFICCVSTLQLQSVASHVLYLIVTLITVYSKTPWTNQHNHKWTRCVRHVCLVSQLINGAIAVSLPDLPPKGLRPPLGTN